MSETNKETTAAEKTRADRLRTKIADLKRELRESGYGSHSDDLNDLGPRRDPGIHAELSRLQDELRKEEGR